MRYLSVVARWLSLYTSQTTKQEAGAGRAWGLGLGAWGLGELLPESKINREA